MTRKGFHTEPPGYTKGAWSDLQGAWENLRRAVVEAATSPEASKLLFHIDEGMSWESVREPQNMRKALLLVQNTALQADIPEEILEWIETVREDFDEVMDAIKEGKAR